MKIKLFVLLLWLNGALMGQQDTFSIEIEPIQIENMPGLHSGAVATINNRWILGKFINQGIFAKVYKCIDLNDNSIPLAIKIY